MERYSALDTKIKNVLESIEKQRMESTSLDKTYPYTKFLSEEKRTAFSTLSEADKMRVTNAYNIKPAYDEEGIVKIWDKTLAKTEVNEEWLINIPTEYLPIWESASNDVKERITRQAKVYNLSSEYQIKNFWQTRGLTPSYNKEVDAINESIAAIDTPLVDENLSKLGYSESYIESIKNGLNRYNNKR